MTKVRREPTGPRDAEGAPTIDGDAGRKRWRRPLLVAVVAMATYAPALRNTYTLDGHLIDEQRAAFASAPLSSLFDGRYFELYIQDTYRPVVTVSTMVDYRLGVDPRIAGHVQTSLWHGATSALVEVLASTIVSPEAALVAALTFAVHPVATEAASCLGFREDVLVAFFAVATVLLSLSPRPGRRRWALLTCLLALFTKENAIVIPALVLLARLTVGRARPLARRAQALELGGLALVTALYLLIRFHVMAGPYPFTDPVAGTFAASIVAAPRILAHDLRLFVVPWPLLVAYSHMFPFGASWASQLPWVLADLGVAAGAVWLARVRPVIGFGMLWYMVALAPTLHLAPMRVETADRFVHLSLVGGALALGGLYDALAQSSRWLGARRVARGAAGVGILALLVLTELRIPTWHDDFTLWTDTLRHNPGAYIGHAVLAQRFEAAGQAAESQRELELALATCPRENEFGRTRFCARYAGSLGFIRLTRGDRDAARKAFDEAMTFARDYIPAVVGYGYLALVNGDLDGARAQAALAERLAPVASTLREMVARFRSDLDRVEAARRAAASRP